MIVKEYGSAHTHTDSSNYRLRDSINELNELCWYAAKELGHSFIAITDHETISTSIRIEDIQEKIRKEYPDFKIIRGNEIYLCRNGLNKENYIHGEDKFYHFILLAKDEIGHKQIRELSTRAWLRSEEIRRMTRVPTYYDDLIDIVGSNKGHVIFSTACFRKGTPVLTKNGYKPIEMITEQDYILNRFGKWEKVNYPTSRQYKGKGYKINFLEQKQPTVCTQNHKFLVIEQGRKENPQWIEAKDLNKKTKTKHICLFPIKNEYSNDTKLRKEDWISFAKTSNNKIKLKDIIEITPELMRFFGLFLGDGCISINSEKKYYSISYTFNYKEFNYYWDSFVKKASEDLGITWSINYRPECNRVDINSHSIELVNLFYYIFGNVKAKTKSIPQRLLNISEELNFELAFGYMLADGYFRSRQKGKYEIGEMVAASISQKLIYDMQDLLKNLCIRCSITETKEKIDKNGVNHQKAYYLSSSNSAWKEINKLKEYTHQDVVDIFKSAQKHCNSKFICINNTLYKKVYIKNIQEIDLEEKVYCLNVGTHSFVCNDVIVHNCIGGKLGQMILKEVDENYIRLWLQNLSEICGKENFFLETQPSYNKEQIKVNQKIKELSSELGFKVIITTDAHYLKKEDFNIHKAFLNAQGGDRETESFYASTYMMGTEEIQEYMNDSIGEETVIEWLKNSKYIYEMCTDYSLKKPLRIPYLPRTINKITDEQFNMFADKIDELEYFYKSEFAPNRDLAAAIVTKILKEPETYNNKKTFDHITDNLKAVRLLSEKQNTQWSAYLLNMRDYVDLIWTKGDSLVGPSRGCFYPNEKVLLYNGTEKNICNIQIGDKVFNHNGEINQVKDIYQYDIEEECYVIKGKGREPIHCTNNHKFYIKKCSTCENPSYKNKWCKETCRRAGKCSYEKSHKVGFVPANELRVGDLLAYPKPKFPPISNYIVDLATYIEKDKYVFIKDDVVGYYIGNNTLKKGKEIPRYLTLNEDLAYVCGVFIGDGWTREREDGEVGFAFNSENEKDLMSLKSCEEFFLSLGLKVTKDEHPRKKVIQMRIYSKVFCQFFRKNFGKDTYEKHICDWLITSDIKISKALLRGLMASDGYYGKDIICYDTVNKQLIKQVQMLWASIGIYGNYKDRIPKNEKWSISYKWSASGKQLEKLVEDFPLINISKKKYTRQDYLEDNDCFYTIIEDIKTETYKGKVYDLNVENIHSYVINGTSVHNSGGGFELLNILDITQINPAKEKAPLRSWRFLNPERVSPLDIDTDIEGGKRAQVYKAFQDEYGKDRVSKVLTIRTEKSKSALLTACRGLNVNPDKAAELASFIKSDRGLPRTLHQTFYGDVENDIQPDKRFQDLMTNEFPDVWEVAQKIEGLCCGVGSHAGGVIFYDEDITNTTALMKTDNGDLVTQYDLRRLEDVGLIKIDLLSIEALDRIRACLDLLVKYGYISAEGKSLKEVYEETIGIYNIEREDPKMWDMLHNHKVQALFQMEQDSGIKGIALTKPQTVEELASINSVMRLMAPEKGQEQPLETFAKRKMDSSIWENEMIAYGLNSDERAWLHKWLDVSYGICETQETLMSMLQEPEIGGHSLLFADKVRKAIAKKKPEEFLACQKVYYEVAKEKGLSKTLTEYTWNVVFAASKGYSFNITGRIKTV